MSDQLFSIIIATRNRPDSLRSCIQSIMQQVFMAGEVIVVDSSSGQATNKLVKELSSLSDFGVEYLRTSPGLTHQRNVGISSAKSDIVGFLDDDVILEPDYLLGMRKAFQDSSVLGACGKDILEKDISTLSRIFARLFYLAEPTAKGQVKASGSACRVKPNIDFSLKIEWMPGYNMFYRREVFESFRFDERFTVYSYLEDLDFSFQVGQIGCLMFVPTSRLRHVRNTAPETRLSKFHRRFMLTLNYHYFFRKNLHFGHFSWLAHAISLLGLLVRSTISDRSFFSAVAILLGIVEVSKAYKSPQQLPAKFLKYYSREQTERLFHAERVAQASH